MPNQLLLPITNASVPKVESPAVPRNAKPQNEMQKKADGRGAHLRTHGASGTPTHTTWKNMLNRCRNPKSDDYTNYGGRGITVCKEWENSFARFLADMGEKPADATIERVNNDLGYSKDNCVWATRAQQTVNRRVNHRLVFNGETLTISQWASKTGLSKSLLYDRINKLKWPVDAALTTPPGPNRPKTA